MSEQPHWPQLAQQLIVAIQSTEHAFAKSRVRRAVIPPREQRHLAALRAERDRYILAARRAINQPDTSGNDWRMLMLNLLRAHSIAWEILWLEHDSGIPFAIESGHAIEGRHGDADRYIDDAIQALAATEPRFNSVEWDGREILRLLPPKS